MNDAKQKQKSLKMSILVSPDMANFSGVMHGGELLKLLDQVAYACATRYCGVGVVTLGVSGVVFRRSISIGSLLHCYASINYTGNTSCEVGIRVETEDVKTGQRIHSNTAYFTMVALDAEGKKTTIPPLTPEGHEEKRRYEEALQRKARRFG